MASISVDIEDFDDDDILNEFIERLNSNCYKSFELDDVVKYLGKQKIIQSNTLNEEMKMDIVLQLYEKMSLSELENLIK